VLMKPIISITDRAADYIKHVLQQQHAQCLEIGVGGKGCNGLSYTFDIVPTQDVQQGDETVSLDSEYQVRIPQECVMYLLGSTVDYHKDAWSSKLVVNNPLATSRCGCGTSFSVA
jgi:iron-sulfur cluster insertion protein